MCRSLSVFSKWKHFGKARERYWRFITSCGRDKPCMMIYEDVMWSGLPAGFAWIQRLGERPGIVLYTYQRRLLALHANIARREENGTSLRHFGSFFPAGHIKSTLEILSSLHFICRWIGSPQPPLLVHLPISTSINISFVRLVLSLIEYILLAETWKWKLISQLRPTKNEFNKII